MNPFRKLWLNLKYYNILFLLIIGILMFIFREPIYALVCEVTGVTSRSLFFDEFEQIVNVCLIAIWVILTFTTIRNKRYYKLTGRHFPRDKSEFKKTYPVLLDFFKNNDPYKMKIEDLPVEDWHDAEGVILCKVKDIYGQYRLVKNSSSGDGKNYISFGIPGSGKTTAQGATSAARFNAHKRGGGCGVFAISIKGDLLNFLKGKRKNIKVFTPDKVEGSWYYNPLDGIEKLSPSDLRVFVENMSINSIQDEPGDNSKFFVDGARDFYCGILIWLTHLHKTGEREGPVLHPEFVTEIQNHDVIEITLIIRDSGCQMAAEYTNSYIGSNEKNCAGIYNHLCKKMRVFNTGALKELFSGKGPCITPNDLETSDIIIDVPQDKYQVYSPALAIIISNFLQAFMRRDDVSSNKDVSPVLFLLDEAAQIGLDYSVLQSSMSTLRSRKISIFLLLQSLAQLEERYGEAQSRTLMDLCAYISVFNAQDTKSREYFQKLVGRRKMLKRSSNLTNGSNNSLTSGTNVTETEEYIFEAADFGDLNYTNPKTGEVTKRVLVYANGKYVLGETTPCYK